MPGNASEEGDVRPRDAGEQHQDRGERGEQDALQDAEQQHGDERDRCGVKIQPADPPHARSAAKSNNPATAVSTTAASTAFGKFSRSPVRKRRHSASVKDAKTSASEVRAPALSFTADCDSPPATG